MLFLTFCRIFVAVKFRLFPYKLRRMNLIQAWIVPLDASAGATAYIVTAIAALLVTGVSKGGFGGGVGILSVPLMLQVASYKFVIGMWLPILIVCDFATIRQYPREWNPRAFWLIAPGVHALTQAMHSLHRPQARQRLASATASASL